MRFILVLLISAPLVTESRAQSIPIIDMHVHAWNAVAAGPEAPENKAYLSRVLRDMGTFNVVLGVMSGPEEFLDAWSAAAPDRFLVGMMFPCDDRGLTPNTGRRPCFRTGSAFPDLAWLREQLRTKRVRVIGELTNQYAGIPFDDARMKPYYELAEEFDVPLAFHIGRGPPLTAQKECCPNFRLALGNPLLLEDVLVRHPRLRVQLMHANPFDNPQLFMMLAQYPQLYVDLTPYPQIYPRPLFHDMLLAYKRAGLLDRVMFGTDYPQYERVLEAYRSADFLTQSELEDVLCRNAARFLRMPKLCDPARG